jgi:translation initiation factor 4A
MLLCIYYIFSNINPLKYKIDNNNMSVENENENAPRNTEESNEIDSSYEFNSWDELEISTDLLRGIYAYGFENPSPIQKKAIKPLIMKKDIIGQAQSGTGKTATFTIGALSNVVLEDKCPQVLVLSPTRELSIQTANVFRGIGSMMDDLRVQILIGGSSIDEDVDNLKKNTPHVIVGCPGRVYDMIRRNAFSAKKIKLVVLDEADELFSIGFKEQVFNIFQNFNKDIQVALFSATLPSYIFSITSKLMRDPVRVSVKAEQLTLEGISQYYVAVEDDKQKYATLKDLYAVISLSQCIIYCNSVKRVSDLYDAMIEDGFPVCRIHSGMDKSDRDNAFAEFRTGKFRVLISSNVTARGIDIQQVSVVINFDISKCVHTYLHRIGRSGRWGRKGVGINLITRRDISKMKEIEAHYSCQIEEMPSTLDKLER